MKKFMYSCIALALLGVLPGRSFAYTLPESDTRAEYFYVFGPNGLPHDGAEPFDHQQVIFFDVPENETEDLTIDIFDPDTGGRLDQKDEDEGDWETITQFAVLGKDDSVLDKKRFGESRGYDMQYYRFGPYAKETGQQVGGFYRFKLVASAVNTLILRGKDINLFSVRVAPENTESFAYKIAFRLLPKEGSAMYFYPELPANVGEISLENYDIDPEGGSASVYDPVTKKTFKVKDSLSGTWAETKVDLGASAVARRLAYIITKKTQQFANTIIQVKDSQGNLLPIYFAQGRRPLFLSQAFSEPLPQKNKVITKEPAPAQQKKRIAPVQHAARPGKKVAAPPVKKIERPGAVAQIKTLTPPKATALQCDTFTFDGTASYDPNKEKLSFQWDFGDGTSGAEPVATHTFQKAGTYTVTLTVKDTSGLACDTATTTYTVNVNVPPQPALSAPAAACTAEAVVFDAGATTDDTPEKLTYAWDFGDNTTAEGVGATKRFEKGGLHTVKLTVNDNAGTPCSIRTIQKDIMVNTPPVARSGGNRSLCFAEHKGYAVVFDAGKSSDPDADAMAYAWDFGDGESATGRTVTHEYKKGGVYIAKLTVDDGRTSACSSNEETFTVIVNKQPVAIAGENKMSCPGIAIDFDGSQSGDPDNDTLGYQWDFGDGTSAQGAQASHAYEKAGTYKATLTVSDSSQTACSAASAGAGVFINAGPKAAIKKPGPVCVATKVAFDASGTLGKNSGDYTYSWDFGDGTTAVGGVTIAHEYKKGGTFTVRVTVDDKRATPCSVDSAVADIVVNTPPVAQGRADFACCIDTDSVFDAAESRDADKDSLAYWWDFGDGSTAQGEKATHRYTKGGTYTVTLKVDDNSGTACSGSKESFKVVINESPVAVIKVK